MSTVLKVIASICLAVSVIASIVVMASSEYGVSIGLALLIGSVISCSLIYAVAEILSRLKSIDDHLNVIEYYDSYISKNDQ